MSKFRKKYNEIMEGLSQSREISIKEALEWLINAYNSVHGPLVIVNDDGVIRAGIVNTELRPDITYNTEGQIEIAGNFHGSNVFIINSEDYMLTIENDVLIGTPKHEDVIRSFEIRRLTEEPTDEDLRLEFNLN